jgi:pyrimidine-nucleoside phosphorylase
VEQALRSNFVRVVELIERKRDGEALSADEVDAIVLGYTRGDVPDYQMSAFLMAVVWRGMDAQETAALTSAMVRSGERLDLGRFGRVVDKHSTGGVGDKTTLVVAPLVAACGQPVAKMSGRGLGFSGGTLDKLESIRGYRVDLTTAEFLAQLERVGIVVSGQTAELAPADGKMYALRDITGTVPSIPLIASSVMSKKIAAGAHAVVLDVKVGSGAFMKDLAQARALAKAMVAIGVAHGMAVTCELTDMDQPLGRAVGNSLEINEAIATLRGQGPDDLVQLVRVAGAEMLLRGGRARDAKTATAKIDRALEDGSGLAKLRELVSAQGGDVTMVDDPGKLPRAPKVETLRAERTAYVAAIAADRIGIASVRLGAGREKKGDPIDHRTGIVLCAKVGDRIERGQPYADVHVAGRTGDADAIAMIRDAFRWSARRVSPRKLVLGRVAS